MRISTKSPWQSKLFLTVFAVLAGAAAAQEESEAHYPYLLRFQSRLAYHLRNRKDLASHRHYLIGEFRPQKGPWTFALSGRAVAEAAFATNVERYGGTPVGQLESSDFALRDCYLEYRESNWIVRAGNQQVVWGEAFGFYFADIVNPKDLREFFLWDLEYQRIPTPMVNVKFLTGRFSLQGIYLPKPIFNLMPALGNDFAPPFGQYFPGAQFSLTDSRTVPWAFSNGEFGFRATGQFSTYDLSVFFLSYFDRMPSYLPSVASLSPLTIALTTEHPRIYSEGATLTADFSDFLLRLEALVTHRRPFGVVENGGYQNILSDEAVAVLGFDYTQLGAWKAGLQLSEDRRFQDFTGAVVPQDRPLLSVHLSGPIWKEQTLDLTLSYNPQDGSSLTEFRYLIPLTQQLELLAAADWLDGGAGSQFGEFRQGSRAYVLLRGYFSG